MIENYRAGIPLIERWARPELDRRARAQARSGAGPRPKRRPRRPEVFAYQLPEFVNEPQIWKNSLDDRLVGRGLACRDGICLFFVWR
jgi:hypothetical protein